MAAVVEKVLLTRQEVAEYLSVHVKTVNRLLAAGELRRVKIGRLTRIRRRELERYVDRHSRGN